MADQVVGAEADVEMIFVYMGGDQVVPDDVRRVRIDKSVKIIPSRAFEFRRRLIDVEFHDGIERVEADAFKGCSSLTSIKLLGVRVIEMRAFRNCGGLTEVEFGVMLETIEQLAFQYCTSLRTVTMPSVQVIEKYAFNSCVQLTDLEVGEELETIQGGAFQSCHKLRRIVIPLTDNMIEGNVFTYCSKLATVDLVGGVHRTVASLHFERWRHEMKDEINRINQVLPNTTGTRPVSKTPVIQEWISSVIRRIDHYKAQHIRLLKEATTLLELALWKAKIDVKEEKESFEGMKAKRVKIDTLSERRELRITSGANIVIKNVLPFLELD